MFNESNCATVTVSNYGYSGGTKEVEKSDAQKLREDWEWHREEMREWQLAFGRFLKLPWQFMPRLHAARPRYRLRLPGASLLRRVAFQRRRQALRRSLKRRLAA